MLRPPVSSERRGVSATCARDWQSTSRLRRDARRVAFMLSLIIPAYNEEQLLARTLRAAMAAAQASGESWEIVVADDASTDRTAAIAAEHGARVVPVHCRQIAKTRNAGARAAKGDLFIFVDADTVVTSAAVAAAVRAMRGGA